MLNFIVKMGNFLSAAFRYTFISIQYAVKAIKGICFILSYVPAAIKVTFAFLCGIISFLRGLYCKYFFKPALAVTLWTFFFYFMGWWVKQEHLEFTLNFILLTSLGVLVTWPFGEKFE